MPARDNAPQGHRENGSAVSVRGHDDTGTGVKIYDGTAEEGARLPGVQIRGLSISQSEENEAENGKPEAVETKYRCQSCEHEWREKVEASLRG